MTEGYVLKMALDKDDQVCGYQFLSLGKMMDAIKKGMSPNEAYEKNIGTYGRFKAEDGAVSGLIRVLIIRRGVRKNGSF